MSVANLNAAIAAQLVLRERFVSKVIMAGGVRRYVIGLGLEYDEQKGAFLTLSHCSLSRAQTIGYILPPGDPIEAPAEINGIPVLLRQII